MIIKSQPYRNKQITSNSKTPNQYISPNPKYPPPTHIFSQDQQLNQAFETYLKSTNKKRKKIFQSKKKKQQPLFNYTTQISKKAGSSIQDIPQFSQSTFVKDQTSRQYYNSKNQKKIQQQNYILSKKNNERNQDKPLKLPTMKSLEMIKPSSKLEISQRRRSNEKQLRLKEMKDKIQFHESQIRQLNERFERKCEKDNEIERKFFDEIKKSEKGLLKKQTDLQQYLRRIQKLQSQNQLKKQQIYRYQLQLQRAKRVQQLAKQNQKLYQEILKNQTKTHDATVSHYFRDHNHNSISALPAKNQIDDSFDHKQIGQLLSPFSINPNQL